MITKQSVLSQSIIKSKLNEILQGAGFITNTRLPYSIPNNHVENEIAITTPVHIAPVSIDLHCGEEAIINKDTVVEPTGRRYGSGEVKKDK